MASATISGGGLTLSSACERDNLGCAAVIAAAAAMPSTAKAANAIGRPRSHEGTARLATTAGWLACRREVPGAAATGWPIMSRSSSTVS